MNTFLYYFDKFTQWLDFSWLVTIPKKYKERKEEKEEDIDPPQYKFLCDPLLDNDNKY